MNDLSTASAEFAVSHPGTIEAGHAHSHALLIGLEMDKGVFVYWIVAGLVLCVMVWLLAGFLAKNTRLGPCTGGGTVAVVAPFECLLFWLLEQRVVLWFMLYEG